MFEGAPNQSFSPGDVVYCVAGEPSMPPAVEKATIDSKLRDGGPDGLPYHYLIVWGQVDQDPCGEGATITRLPSEIFSKDEVETVLNSKDTKYSRDIDGLVANPIGNLNLTASLGGAVINRMIETPHKLFEAYSRISAWQA